jgi:hypothetical protein
MSRRNDYAPFLGFLLIISILLSQIQQLEGTSESSYNAGYDHGCDDADFRYPGDRYINQPGKGPSQHSDQFMNGYEDGFNACNDKGYQITTDLPELDDFQHLSIVAEQIMMDYYYYD